MSISSNMGLTLWDQEDDLYNHTQLAINFETLDVHDHTLGRGKRIITASIQDQAVTTPKLADGGTTTAKMANANVTNPKLADGAVNPRVLGAASVTTVAIADRSVTSPKLADDIVPVGTIISWWRPNGSTPLPLGWVVADGSTLLAVQHDFAGGGTIQVPDMRNRFVLGAATGGTGTGTTQPPGIGQAGGTNLANLSHTHGVPHAHTVSSHTHGVNAHVHTVDAHTHTLNTHNHTVSHNHTVGPHTHSSPGHSHGMPHVHGSAQHTHAIASDGNHQHTFAGSYLFSRRSYIYAAPQPATEDRQTLFVSGFNSGGTSAYTPIDAAGLHSHGGGTGYNIFQATSGAFPESSASSVVTTSPNAAHSSEDSAPSTSPTGGVTQAATPGTSAATTTTAASTPSTSTDTPVSDPGLTTQDIRPAYIGLLQLIKVKH